jgi:hypothetical protein
MNAQTVEKMRQITSYQFEILDAIEQEIRTNEQRLPILYDLRNKWINKINETSRYISELEREMSIE